MAEIEFNVLHKQCLNRNLDTKQEVIDQIKAWLKDRNRKTSKINWQFTTEDARTKLKHLYPSILT